jgi:Ca-activated chloride channel family protein
MPTRIYRSLGRCRNTGRMWGVLCVALFFSAVIPAPGFQDTTTPAGEFKISTDVVMVLLDVSVKDPRGGYVSGLSKDDFQVYENGALQKLTVFSSADVPVAVGLVMDESGSMHNRRPHTITAGLVFIGASNPQDQVFVVNFNDTVRSGLPSHIPFSGDLNILHAALSRAKAEGQTALYDAIAFALHHLESAQRDKKTLLVVSDGGDNRSRRTLPELMRLIQESQVTIYTIGIYDADDADRNPQVLKRISYASGGECFLPQTVEEIAPICRKIALDIRNRYTMGYVPDRTAQKGGVRKIRVAISAPDHRNSIVRTRAGYSLPDELVQPPGTHSK